MSAPSVCPAEATPPAARPSGLLVRDHPAPSVEFPDAHPTYPPPPLRLTPPVSMSEMERADPSDFAAPPPAAPPNSTIDEPVSETILRDVRLVGRRLSLVMLPGVSASARSAALRDWDLWGPLFVCMSLAVLLSVESAGEGSLLFSLIFVIVWAGAAVVTINGQLLGGRLAFFGSVCLLGYCIAPLLVAAAGCVLVNATVGGGVAVVVRFGLVVAGLAWSIWGRLGCGGLWFFVFMS